MLDTNASLALFAFADPECSSLLEALRTRRLLAMANDATRAEWSQVIQREELQLDSCARIAAAASFDEWVELASPAVPAVVSQPLPRCRDRDDQMFLELARDVGAIALYTRDRQLLRLSRQTARIAGFVVVRPEDYRA